MTKSAMSKMSRMGIRRSLLDILRPSAMHGRLLFDALPVQRNIKAFAFLLFRHAQADGHVDDFQDDEAHRESIDERHGHALD